MADSSLGEVQQHLHVYTDEQTKVLDAMEVEARLKFPPSTTAFYADINTLKSAVQKWAHAKGFHTSYHGHGLWCKRAEQPKSFQKATAKARLKNNIPVEHQRQRKSMRCGCEFVINFANATPKSIKAGMAQAGSVRITAGSHYRQGEARRVERYYCRPQAWATRELHAVARRIHRQLPLQRKTSGTCASR
jgi:hypothetical protein